MEMSLRTMNKLYDLVAYHRDKYYNDDNPEITDSDYDKLIKLLKLHEEKFPENKRDISPSTIVGGEASSKFTKVNHNVPMLSLDNVFNEKELMQFYKRVRDSYGEDLPFIFVCEMKIDGLAISLHYNDGRLTKAVTRGDGHIGEDVTDNVKMIKSIPQFIEYKNPIEIRGEIIIKNRDFANLNKMREENGEPVFANPRNAAAGTLRQLDSKIVKERNLSAFMYYIVNPFDHGIHTQTDCLIWLKGHDFPVQDAWARLMNAESCYNFITDWQNRRHNLGYETDGVVLKLDNIDCWDKIGYTSHHPKFAIAYKYPPEEAITTLRKIEVQVGRTGVLTPVAVFDSVTISGSTISRASLHNYDEIAKNDYRIGDNIAVRKAAEIIPEVVKRVYISMSSPENIIGNAEHLPNSEKIVPPTKCPICGSDVIRIDNEVAYRCSNKVSCPAQLKESIKYFASKRCMNIMGLGDKLAEQLVNLKLINNISDIYNLTIEQLSEIDRMGEKSAENIINAINESKNRSFASIIAALQIKYVAIGTAEKLAKHFKNIDNIINADLDEITKIDDIGETTAELIVSFFEDDKNLELIEKLKECGVNFKENVVDIANKINNDINNKVFVFTGALHSMSRDDAAEKVKVLGGKVASTVSNKTDYVVSGENSGSKLAKAYSLGVKVINETQFIELIS